MSIREELMKLKSTLADLEAKQELLNERYQLSEDEKAKKKHDEEAMHEFFDDLMSGPEKKAHYYGCRAHGVSSSIEYFRLFGNKPLQFFK